MANEKRLIDANALVEKLQTDFKRIFTNAGKKVKPEDYYITRKAVYNEDLYKAEVDDFCLMVDCFPTVDAVEVVRCKDCKRWKYDAKRMAGICSRHINYTAQWDFCNYGERRKDGNL